MILLPRSWPLTNPFSCSGSWILHAHSTLQRYAGMGYLSEWANNQFPDVSAKNEFYASFGESFSPRGDDQVEGFP
ncbi:MAG: hypothetical protein ACJZ72_03955 [Opitutales bacterium]